MEKICYIAALLILPAIGYSQSSAFVSDQNPRYQESQDHYMKLKDSLVTLHGTTVQNTYKAYDWREDRAARRQQRREWRHQERLYEIMYGGYDYYGYYPYSSGYYYRPYSGHRPYWGYGNRWRSGFHLGAGYSW
jgi:hypothetical protein